MLGQKVEIAGMLLIHTLYAPGPQAEVGHRVVAWLIAQKVCSKSWVAAHLACGGLWLLLQFAAHEHTLEADLCAEVQCLDGIIILVGVGEGVCEASITQLLVVLLCGEHPWGDAVPGQDGDLLRSRLSFPACCGTDCQHEAERQHEGEMLHRLSILEVRVPCAGCLGNFAQRPAAAMPSDTQS